MAPPARHTKSAAWALITRTVFFALSTGRSWKITCEYCLAYKRGGILNRHAPHVACRETCIEQPLREHGEALRHRWVDGLAQVRRKQAALRPGAANTLEYAFPRRLSRVHGGEAMLDHRPHVRQFALLVR